MGKKDYKLSLEIEDHNNQMNLLVRADGVDAILSGNSKVEPLLQELSVNSHTKVICIDLNGIPVEVGSTKHLILTL